MQPTDYFILLLCVVSAWFIVYCFAGKNFRFGPTVVDDEDEDDESSEDIDVDGELSLEDEDESDSESKED